MLLRECMTEMVQVKIIQENVGLLVRNMRNVWVEMELAVACLHKNADF